MSDSRGTFVWYELRTGDVNAAIEFYRDVIGWRTQAWEGDLPYSIWTAGDIPVGGVTAQADDPGGAGARPYWLAYVTADDVDALTGTAASLGATTQAPPADIPKVGRASVVADPQGAVLALFRPSGSAMPRPESPANGHVVWHELLADDSGSALGFYARLFGWQKTDALDMGAMGTYQMYGKGGRTFGGMMKRPEGYPWPPHWLYYVHVDDLDAATGRVRSRGGRVMNGPMEIPGGERVAQCIDPQGATFALHGK